VPQTPSASCCLVLAALERLQAKLVQREEWTHSETLGNLRETLQSPLFNHILTLQHSIKQLRSQLSAMPPNTSSDFSFSKKGQLIMSVDPVSGPGRPTDVVRLTRPLTGGLGFSVVGLNPTGSSSRGVFIKHVQPGGIAHRDGRLQERDQILVINGSPLEPGISQQQALSLLQQPGETVELVVARGRPPDASLPPTTPINPWDHVEEIELVNDGSGLGFGIVGGKTSGVVVRTLIRNGVADRDGRLRTGDHILRIGATPTSGLTSDQVVQVLQGCGSRVNMLIARDPQGQQAAAPPPPPPPVSAPVSSLPPQTPKLPPQNPPQRHAVGVFVKHVVPGSAADQSGNIQVQDRLIALDGVSLHGLTNQEVQEVMKQTGQTVILTLVRKKARALERSLDKGMMEVKVQKNRFNVRRPLPDRPTSSSPSSRWRLILLTLHMVNLDPVIEDDEELQKSSKLLPVHTLRLGVELDSFDGHHYISSVAPGGPVDRHGVLRPEDELLEVNDVQLYGKSRREVVSFLKEVPPPFTLVCCRHPIADLEPESESEPEPVLRLEPKAGPARQSQRGVEEVRTGLFMVPWDGICSNNYFISSYDRKDEKHHCLV
uniref:PATJ crumbs cell polarity complex component n=1 Tax=Haplochromis burtoni TaxID=8153 RepID=A0A3Q2V7A7_HAPBU